MRRTYECGSCGNIHVIGTRPCVIITPRPAPAPPPDDAPTPDDAPMLSAWSGHNWYADLGGEGGHE